VTKIDPVTRADLYHPARQACQQLIATLAGLPLH